MSRFGRLLGLIVGVGGFVAAYAFAPPGNAMELPPTPTVTVGIPSLPAPPVPAPVQPPPLPAPVLPAPPPVTPPVTAPSVPTPTVTTPPVVGTPPAPAADPVSGAASSSPQAIAGRSSSGESRTEKPRATKRSRQLEAKPHRAKGRVSVRLEFTLAKAERRFLIVRGPAPSCRVAGIVPVRGRKGVNTVDFAGRVRGRPLELGVYLLTVSPTRRPADDAPTEYVRVVSARRSVPLADSERKPSCSEAQALAADPTARLLRGEERKSAATPSASRPAAPLRPPIQAPGPDPDGREQDGLSGLGSGPGVLGASTGGGDLAEPATLIVLTVVAALLIMMLVLVTRFLRGGWNP